jgi:hypothetical protein
MYGRNSADRTATGPAALVFLAVFGQGERYVLDLRPLERFCELS